MKQVSLFISQILLVCCLSAAPWDPYAILESVLTKEEFPRLLNTIDIENLGSNDPAPLINPVGDFNHDGAEDMAISGLFELRQNEYRYFLLIATPAKEKFKFKKIFYREFPKPVFIHLAGTTGDLDPGNQEFSISFCENCSQGFDLYWDKRKKYFRQQSWAGHSNRFKKTNYKLQEKLPQSVVEKALRIVGRLPHVNEYVNELNKRNGELGIRVSSFKKIKKNKKYWVAVFEKKGEEEILFDNILVHLKKDKAVKIKTVKP